MIWGPKGKSESLWTSGFRVEINGLTMHSRQQITSLPYYLWELLD